MLIGIDPAATYGEGFCKRLEPLVSAFNSNGNARIPGDGRLKRRDTTKKHGVLVRMELWEKLQALAKPAKA